MTIFTSKLLHRASAVQYGQRPLFQFSIKNVIEVVCGLTLVFFPSTSTRAILIFAMHLNSISIVVDIVVDVTISLIIQYNEDKQLKQLKNELYSTLDPAFHPTKNDLKRIGRIEILFVFNLK